MQAISYMHNRTFAKDAHLNTLIFLPNDYDPLVNKTYPLLLFLHGSGERGEDLSSLQDWVEQIVLPYAPQNDMIIIAPQCPSYHLWGQHLDDLHQLIISMRSLYRVRSTQQYVTGVSMGGGGTWQFALHHPQVVTAIAPICTWGGWRIRDAEQVCQLGEMPIWLFHGEKDSAAPVKESKELMAVLETCNPNAKLTVYPDADHDVWHDVFASSILFDWFLDYTTTT